MSLAATITGLVIKPITDLISEMVEDKDKAAELKSRIETLASEQAHAIDIAQIEVNKIEASSKSLFVAGWRPFIGWTCGVAMGFNYLVVPVAGAAGYDITALDTTTMFPVLLGLLGLGSLRTYEKTQGVARETMKTTKG